MITGDHAPLPSAPQLANPAKDATAIAQMFRDAGFDKVDLQLNLGTLDFKRAVRKFENSAEKADIAVISPSVWA